MKPSKNPIELTDLTERLTERLSFEIAPDGVVRPVLHAEVLLRLERRNLRRARLRWGLGVGAILAGFFAADLVAARFLSLPEGVGLGLYVCAGLCAGAAAMVAKSIR